MEETRFHLTAMLEGHVPSCRYEHGALEAMPTWLGVPGVELETVDQSPSLKDTRTAVVVRLWNCPTCGVVEMYVAKAMRDE